MEKRVLIIAYYWPPAGGGGVQRWLKFSKYLVREGWDVHVYTPDEADYPLIDDSLSGEVDPRITVIRTKIFEPRKLFTRFVGCGRKHEKIDQLFYNPNKTWKEKIGLWIRANMFVPDARVTWVNKSINFLTNYLKQNQIDTVISTGPPHSLHLIALKLKHMQNIKWLADFRDPWTDIEYFEHMPVTGWAYRKHKRLERQVLKEADHVITVSPSWKTLFETYGANKVHVITNGFDEEDFADMIDPPFNKKITICHAGTLSLDRDPAILWKALSLVKASYPKKEIAVEFLGSTDTEIIRNLKTKTGCQVLDHGYLPHNQAIRIMHQATCLLLILNESSVENEQGRIPGKIFEYMALKRPILLIGNQHSDAAKLVNQFEQNFVCGRNDDPAELVKFLLELSTQKKDHEMPQSTDLSQYSRKYLTGKLIKILEKMQLE